jgi:FtsZ-binding cell division protein ZapB
MRNFARVVGFVLGAAVLCSVTMAAQQGEAVVPARGQRGRLTPAARTNMPAPQGFSVVLVLGEMQGSGTGAADNVPPAARKALVDMKDFLPYKSYRLLDSQWTLCCGHSMIATRLRGPEQQDYDLELDPGPSETSGKWNVRFSLREAASSPVTATNGVTGDRVATVAARRAELEAKIKQLKERYNDNHPEVRMLREQLAALDREQDQMRLEESARRYRIAAVAGKRRALIDTSFTMDIGETVVVGTSRLQGDKALIALLTAVTSTKPAPAR